MTDAQRIAQLESLVYRLAGALKVPDASRRAVIGGKIQDDIRQLEKKIQGEDCKGVTTALK